MQIIPSKSLFTTQNYGVFICFLLSIYSFTLTALMFKKFTYSMSILLTVVTRTTTENPVFCVPKAKSRYYKEGNVQSKKRQAIRR